MSENLYTPYIPVRYFEKSISPENDRKTLFLGCIDMKPWLEISKILEIRKLTDLSQKKYNLSIYVSIFLSIYLYLSIYNWASCFRKQEFNISHRNCMKTRLEKEITVVLICALSYKSGGFSQSNKWNKLTDDDASSPATSINRELSSGHVNKCDRVKFCARLPP